MKKTISGIFFLIAACNVWACSCVHQPLSAKKMNESDLVFLGKIIEREIVDNDFEESPEEIEGMRLEYFKYTIKVLKEVRGSMTNRQVEVYSPTQGSACGVYYEPDEVIYIFTYSWKGKQFTGLCSQNIKKEKLTRKQRRVF